MLEDCGGRAPAQPGRGGEPGQNRLPGGQKDEVKAASCALGHKPKSRAPLAIMLRTRAVFWVMGSHPERSGIVIRFADVLESTWHIADSQSTFIYNFELTSFSFFPRRVPAHLCFMHVK